MLGVSERTIRRMIDSGDLPARKLPTGALSIRIADLDALGESIGPRRGNRVAACATVGTSWCCSPVLPRSASPATSRTPSSAATIRSPASPSRGVAPLLLPVGVHFIPQAARVRASARFVLTVAVIVSAGAAFVLSFDAL